MQKWVQETISLVEPEARKRHVNIVLQDMPSLELYGDRSQLQQVLVNLLMNAIQVSDAQQQVEIAAQRMGAQLVRIIVTDRGTGIDEINLSKVFDPFFTTKVVGEGSGLGLSISLGIVQFHNGSLTLVNNLKGGVDAVVTLPLSTVIDETK